ncbi:MAG: hypothetical protein KAG53_10160 [Endozoicomonadaceae bacterium]|nr:hypothetical protein [Endozoicomonadaceae bacterium]
METISVKRKCMESIDPGDDVVANKVKYSGMHTAVVTEKILSYLEKKTIHTSKLVSRS